MPQTILVVDDDQSLRTALVKVFVKAGYRVVAAADGDEAVGYARTRPFRLILADLRMPKLGGAELVRQLKLCCPEAALIVVTAVNDGQIRSDVLENGAFACISKPIRRDQLLTLAQRAMVSLEYSWSRREEVRYGGHGQSRGARRRRCRDRTGRV
jgi:CheY-like chemotaxis protein